MREWQTVTVAFALSSRLTSGRPDQDRAADDHRLRPAGSDPGAGRAAPSPPAACRGRGPGAPGRAARRCRRSARRRPWPGRSRRSPRPGRCWSGSGSWTRIPSTSSSALSSATRSSSSSCEVEASEPVVDRAHPDLLGVLRACCARRRARRGRRRPAPWPARSAACRARPRAARPRATRSRTSAATALPSITVAAISCAFLQRRVVGHQLALGRRRWRSGRRSRRPARPRSPRPRRRWRGRRRRRPRTRAARVGCGGSGPGADPPSAQPVSACSVGVLARARPAPRGSRRGSARGSWCRGRRAGRRLRA